MNVLFIGDIFAGIGRRVLAQRLRSLREEHDIHLCIANGENTAGGNGITHNNLRKLKRYGVDVVTGGNHSFACPDIVDDLVNDRTLLRPLNYPPGNPGRGSTTVRVGDHTVGIVNLLGRIFSAAHMDCPFRLGRKAIEELRRTTPLIIVDFHAEATSEKMAFARYVAGSVSAIIGTHTHVQTADETILDGGTAFITDAGMSGPRDSVIGMDTEPVIKKFLLQSYVRFSPSKSGAQLNGVVLDLDETTGKARSIRRIYEQVELT